MSRTRVLLADDHMDFLPVVTKLLETKYEIVGAVSDGQAAVDAALAFHPDVLVLDISMPVLNGFETARKLRAAGLDSKILFLTVHDDLDYIRAAVAAGADGYVIKGRLATDLVPALSEVMAGRPFLRQFQN